MLSPRQSTVPNQRSASTFVSLCNLRSAGRRWNRGSGNRGATLQGWKSREKEKYGKRRF